MAVLLIYLISVIEFNCLLTELAAPYLKMDYISKHNGYSIYVIHANDTQYSPELIQRLITDCKPENGLNHGECGVDVLYSDFGWRVSNLFLNSTTKKKYL